MCFTYLLACAAFTLIWWRLQLLMLTNSVSALQGINDCRGRSGFSTKKYNTKSSGPATTTWGRNEKGSRDVISRHRDPWIVRTVYSGQSVEGREWNTLPGNNSTSQNTCKYNFFTYVILFTRNDDNNNANPNDLLYVCVYNLSQVRYYSLFKENNYV